MALIVRTKGMEKQERDGEQRDRETEAGRERQREALWPC